MRIFLPLMSAALLLLPASSVGAASSASTGSTISLEVPVNCKLVHRGDFAQLGDAYSLGQLYEYCNAPGGFLVQVEYQPGSLQGATVQVGEQTVVLDGSGHNQVMGASGPKISTVNVVANPGSNAFDAGALQFQIVPL
jgi:hypothetical protein